MNPEPPPIADPHSTAPSRPATAPRTLGTILLALIYVASGVPVLAAGIAFAVISVYDRARWSRGLNDPLGIMIPVFFVLILCGLGFTLIRQGLRIWKHGR